MEYNKLNYMWDKFGLNKHDLQKEDPKWVEEVYLVGLGIEKYKSFKMDEAKNGSGKTPIIARGKRVERTKLL